MHSAATSTGRGMRKRQEKVAIPAEDCSAVRQAAAASRNSQAAHSPVSFDARLFDSVSDCILPLQSACLRSSTHMIELLTDSKIFSASSTNTVTIFFYSSSDFCMCHMKVRRLNSTAYFEKMKQRLTSRLSQQSSRQLLRISRTYFHASIVPRLMSFTRTSFLLVSIRAELYSASLLYILLSLLCLGHGMAGGPVATKEESGSRTFNHVR